MKMRISLLTAVLILTTLLTTTLNSKPNVSPAPESTTNTADDPIFIGAGDIGECLLVNGKYVSDGTMAEATARLVVEHFPSDSRMGVVFVAGDNAYEEGTKQQYEECYGPTWGKFKDHTAGGRQPRI